MKFSVEIALVTSSFLGFSDGTIQSREVRSTLLNVKVRFGEAKVLNVLNILCILRFLVYVLERQLF